MLSKSMKLLIYLLFSDVFTTTFGQSYANHYPYPHRKRFKYSDLGATSDGDGFTGENLFQSRANNEVLNNKENSLEEHKLNKKQFRTDVDDQRFTIGQNVETDKSHNRKYTKSGFHITYNKDESGSNSSYHEDSDDHAGKLIYDKRHDDRGKSIEADFNENIRQRNAYYQDKDRDERYKADLTENQQHFSADRNGDRDGNRNQFTGENGNNKYFSAEDVDLTVDNEYFRMAPVLEFVRPTRINYRDRGYNNGGLTELVNELETSLVPPSPPTNLFDEERDKSNDYFSRRRITIYEDPRDFAEPYHYYDQYRPTTNRVVRRREKDRLIYRSQPIMKFWK